MRAAVSWARIEHCASPDLSGYKAARAPTLSASQVNFVSWGSVVGRNEWARQTCLENDCEKKGVFPLSFCVCVFRLHLLTIPLSDQWVHVAFICHWNKANTFYQKAKNMRKSLDYGKIRVPCVSWQTKKQNEVDCRRKWKKKSLKKEGYCGYERKWHQIYWRQCEKMRDTRLPPNLTKQDCCCPPAAAAATGGALPHTIIGFHYAAISLK